jgi:hypothetical protein
MRTVALWLFYYARQRAVTSCQFVSARRDSGLTHVAIVPFQSLRDLVTVADNIVGLVRSRNYEATG